MYYYIANYGNFNQYKGKGIRFWHMKNRGEKNK